jgi:3-phosphoinositide dependent protein kinase-1
LLDEKNHLKVIDFGTSKFIDNGQNHEFIERIKAVKKKFSEPRQTMNNDGDETIHERLEHRNSFVGTPIYLSPELIREEEVSFPADIWALGRQFLPQGIMLYQMLIGTTPWQSDSDYDLYESIKSKEVSFPSDFDHVAKDLISKLLDKNPESRLGSGADDTYSFINKLQ